jgi:O-antigen/teichoic acid export membrane protein
MSDNLKKLTSGQRLARNVFWNLVGTGAPLLVAIVAVPMLIEGLGTVRFGMLTLAWMMVGYFNLFDMGLGRALTKLVAEKIGKEQDDEIPALIWAAMTLMMFLGVSASFALASLSPWLVNSILKIPPELQPETLTTFYLLAATMPFVITTTGLRGILEARQRFGLINAVRIPLGIFSFLGPALVVSFSTNLVPVVATLVAARFFFWCVYVALCFNIEPNLRYSFGMHRSMVEPLIKFGGWMTVVNLIRPLMVYLDRFLIGAMLSMAAVAYYTTPYEIATKLWIIPGALMGVLFPALSVVFVQDKERAARLCNRAVKYIFLSLFPVALFIVTFAHEGLNIWLDNEFADKSSTVLQILAVGVFINCHAHVPSGMVQSAGRPDITAKLHLAELPVYLLLLWWMLDSYGIVGVAIAWALRVSVDTVLLFVILNRILPTASLPAHNHMFMFGMALFALLIGGMITGLIMKGIFLLLVLFSFALVVWSVGLSVEEKSTMRCYLDLIKLISLQDKKS